MTPDIHPAAGEQAVATGAEDAKRLPSHDRKPRVAVVFGGRSSEHGVSAVTGGAVLEHIDRDRYDVLPIGITRDGLFVLLDDDASSLKLADPLPEIADNGRRILWPTSPHLHELHVDEGGELRSLGEIDVVFPLLHGPYGEDGTVQGMFEMLGLPYVGNGVLASSAAMNKHVTKVLLRDAGLNVTDGIVVHERAWREDPDRVEVRASALGWPLFVKPNRAGSSVGVSKVTDPTGLDEAMRIAFAEDSMVLVEKGLEAREIEVGVLEGRDGDPCRVSRAGEIVVTGADFYDFETKYLRPEAATISAPADVEGYIEAELHRMAARAFETLDCRGLARVDFFVTNDGVLINEVNTMPGFTPLSMYPLVWQKTGLDYTTLISELVELGIAADRSVKG